MSQAAAAAASVPVPAAADQTDADSRPNHRYFAQHSNLEGKGIGKPRSKPILLEKTDDPESTAPTKRLLRRRRRKYSESSSDQADSDESSYTAPSSSSSLSSSSSSLGDSPSSDREKGSNRRQYGNQPARVRIRRKTSLVHPLPSSESPAASSSSSSRVHVASAVGAPPSALMQSRKKVNGMIVACISNPTFAPLIERALYSKHGGVNKAYNNHARELISSLKLLASAAPAASQPAREVLHEIPSADGATPLSLFEQICGGSISASRLVNMSASELAPESLQQIRLQEAEKHMRQSVVTSTTDYTSHSTQVPSSVSASPPPPSASSSSLVASKKRKVKEPAPTPQASSIEVSKRTKRPIEVCEILDDEENDLKNGGEDEIMILPSLEKPSFRSSPIVIPATAKPGSDHLVTFNIEADAVPVYDGRLSFAQPRRGELHVHFFTLPAPLLFPNAAMDATLDCTESIAFPASSRLNCWRELLPADLDEPQRMNLLKIDTYIQFKSTSHKDAQSPSSSGIFRHENYQRFYPVSFVMRNMDILLEDLRKDLTKFHLSHDLAIALNFEHSHIPVEQQCCIWLMPPDTVKYLSQDTMRRILHWSHVPPNSDWWGILWIKLGAYEAMWQKFRSKQRKIESVMDVPSDDEVDEQNLQQKASDSSLSSISPTPQPPAPTSNVAKANSPDAVNEKSNDLLTLMHNPAVASSTAQYLSTLLQKVRSAPPTAAAPPPVPPIATAPTPVTPPAMPPSPYAPMPPHAYHQPPPPPPPGVYPPATPAPLAYPPLHYHYPPNPHDIYAAQQPFVPFYPPHAPAYPPLPIALLRPPPPPSYGGLQPPYFPPLEPEDLQQSTWNSSVKQPRHH